MLEIDSIQKTFLQSEQGRHWVIQKAIKAVPEAKNWQENHTPYYLCERMIDKSDYKDKKILVLFNIEFVEVLIKKFGVHSSNITFLADCRLEYEMAIKAYKVNVIEVFTKKINDIQEALKNMGKTFDLCFSNPAYQGITHLKILDVVYTVCSRVVFVHPGGWLIDKRPESNKKLNIQGKKIKNKIDGHIRSVDLFYGNDVFDVNLYVPCIIIDVDENYKGPAEINLFGRRTYQVDNINDISIFDSAWLEIVKPFKEMLEIYCQENGNLLSFNQVVPNNRKELQYLDKTKIYCQFTLMQAIVNKPKKDDVSMSLFDVDMYEEDFFRIINPNQNYKFKYDEIAFPKDPSNNLLCWFNYENECNNFINYLKTDFARFCLAIYKFNNHLFEGSECIVPIFNFSEEWSDEKLYEFFNIPQETIDYITNFFSKDLYNLRNKS